MASLRKQRLTPDEYLAIERAADHKSEYVSGEMFAMAGATTEHVQISFNVSGALWPLLRGRDCQGLGSDMRVKVTETTYTYPDMIVVCGEMKHVDNSFDTLTNPTVIFEVLSESTEGYDRGEKFALYRRLESLRQYVLISQDKARVEWFIRQPDGHWLFSEANSLDASLELPTISCQVPLAEIYDRVEFGETSDSLG